MSGMESFASLFLVVCTRAALIILTISFLLIVVRIVRGPTLPDRVVALDMLVAVGIGFIAAIGVLTDYYLYIDIALTLGLVGFLATVAFARFVYNRGTAGDKSILKEVGESIARRKAGQ
ncbi:cation:proton antiporter [Roseibium aestuarii]|uniref:Cation:proton antiporter n=1 Tax=Roseibium aestuarii TaxID=2600299 RepID=A0ABW4JX86_9HYPH|nr:cation:proton antiporter [Roseibium aestuarii]